ncbi:MAG: metal-dependent transcriptional regulator [Acholeplasmataceae bacterium]|nr:metal-dependent transcriptional regulator [Acholeplasmataceae bacterium]
MRNRAEEDYIKAIYELTVERNIELIKTNELSERFNYTDQSVNEMIKRLDAKKLVTFYPYRGVELTQKGKNIAIKMIRAHRLWEVFLTMKLGFSWESVHEDAEMLEHASSDELLNKLDTYLGNPQYCQHGNPIPNFKGKSAQTYHDTMLEVKIGDSFEIVRVLDVKELLIYLNEQKIRLYDQFLVIDKDEFNHLMTIENKTQKLVLSYKTAKMIFIKKI